MMPSCLALPALAVALAVVAGCSRAPAADATTAVAPVAATVAADTPAAGHAFAFLASDPDSRDPRITGWVESDCGPLAVVMLSRMPLEDELLRPDIVVEFDADGRELRRWAKPYSSEILAIAGDDLWFRGSRGGDAGPFRTRPDGTVTLAVPIATGLSSSTTEIDCPDALDGFADMAQVACHQASDSAGRPLRLAWEAGCP